MMKELTIQMMALSDLAPAEYNPRTISPAALAGLRGSVERFGLVEPVVWNRRTGRVVGGHQRLKVLQAMGETETQVVVVDLEETEEKALNIALNSPSIAGEFTADLHKLLAEIDAAMPELSGLLRFDDLAAQTRALLADLTPNEGATDPDDVPEAPDEPITQPGNLWVMGRHRLVCGDSGDPAVLERLMDGQVAQLYATDPPYGVGYDGTSHPQNRRDKDRGREAGTQNRDWSADYSDHDAWDHFGDKAEFEGFLERVFLNAKGHVDLDAAWYCWHASATAGSFLKAWDIAGIRYHQTITWVKPTHVLGFAMWNYRTEPCLMGWQQGHKPHALPVPDEHSNCWEVDWEGKARCTDGQHPTQKPVRLFELPMLKHTRPGAVCLETFAGSGSQIIAAERLDRRCFAVERMPRFCDVIVTRWEKFTGQTAVRIPQGEVR
ncbi:ParB N-terminal domain-containing protein [bacterium]|nr:ParB N-terminal domain-containing protein [bacterium]